MGALAAVGRYSLSMAFIDLLKQLLQGDSDDIVTEDVARGVELRETLNDNPNDIGSFQELSELVNDAARERATVEDPLTADHDDTGPESQAELAMWSLAEELSAKPSAWYPLIELARLSVDSDYEGANRRLTTAVQRDDTGRALGEAIKVLRGADLADAGMALGIGHWDPENQKFAAGEQLILAAIDAKRPDEARRFLTTLTEYAKSGEHEDRVAFLASLIERASNETE